MSVQRKVAAKAGEKLAPKYTGSWARGALELAIDGVGPLRSAAAAADAKLVDRGGDVEAAVGAMIRSHSGLAGIQGFVTNLGGFAAMAVSVPTNVAGVMLVQCHLVAGIAHLRGYDLHDPQVRNAILACMLGEGTVKKLISDQRLPSRPMVLATSPAHHPQLDTLLNREVVTEAIARAAGKRAVTLIGRRVPVLGGAVGASTDALATWQVGQYAADELKDRRVPTPG